MAYTPETAFALEPEYAPFAEQNQPPPVYVRPAEASAAEADAASGTDALSGIVAPADFVTDADQGEEMASAEGGADGTTPSEPPMSEPPPAPPGDAGGDDGGYRRR